MNASRKPQAARRSPVFALLPLLGAAAFAGSAFAQEQAQLEEVIVTAQKREESLREVPISITAFTANALKEMQIRNIVDVSNHTPNFTLNTQGSSNLTLTVSMRGVGNNDTTLSNDTPIGIYIDGVLPNAHSLGNVPDLNDVERVEVLRGPQGTLYGRNTPAGAVNLVTRKPTGELSLDLSAGVGNYNEHNANFGLNLPRWDLGGLGNLAVRVSGSFLKRDGWVKNLADGQYFDSRNRQAGRIALRWTANDALVVDYDYSFFNANELPPVNQVVHSTVPAQQPYVRPRRSTVTDLSIGNCHPGGAAFGVCGDHSVDRNYTHALHAVWTVSPALVLKYIGAYSGVYNPDVTDFDGSPLAILDSYNLSKLGTLSQEINATGTTDDGGLSYVGGVYFSHEHGFNTNPGAYGGGTVQVASTYGMINESKAVYGQVDWKPDVLDRKMTLTAGLRYTQESRKLINAGFYFDNVFALASLPRAKKDYSKMTPAFTVKYDFTDETNGYFRYAQGWRSGGFNGRASTSAALSQPFQPENTKSFEVGMKGSFFEKRLDYSTAVFYTKYDNLQIVQVEPIANGGYASVNANVGKVNITGLELELNALLTPSLKVSASYGYVDTNVKQYQYCVPTAGGACVLQNIGNNRQLYYSPRSNATLGVEYRIVEATYGTWRARVDANWRDAQSGGAETIKFRPFATDPAAIPSYGLVNGRIALEDIPLSAGHGEVSLWVRNVLNADGPVASSNLEVVGLGYSVVRFLEPRTYGVDFSYHY